MTMYVYSKQEMGCMEGCHVTNPIQNGDDISQKFRNIFINT